MSMKHIAILFFYCIKFDVLGKVVSRIFRLGYHLY
jgi:hypothetical protein